jgi:hypothetical protein
LVGNRQRLGRASDLEVVAPPSQIDDPRIVRVLENANEHSLIETLAVAAENLARALANGTGAGRVIIIGRQRFDRATHEVECFAPR